LHPKRPQRSRQNLPFLKLHTRGHFLLSKRFILTTRRMSLLHNSLPWTSLKSKPTKADSAELKRSVLALIESCPAWYIDVRWCQHKTKRTIRLASPTSRRQFRLCSHFSMSWTAMLMSCSRILPTTHLYSAHSCHIVITTYSMMYCSS